MKALTKKTISFVLFLFFIACSNSGPKPVAENFLTALSKLDFEKAKTYGTEDTGKLLDMMNGFAKMIPDSSKHKESKFEITGEKIDGEKASVMYKEEGKEGEQSIPLVKVDGKWKVAMSKDNMNATQSGTSEETDSTENENPAPSDTTSK